MIELGTTIEPDYDADASGGNVVNTVIEKKKHHD